jgi:hypothetical protein
MATDGLTLTKGRVQRSGQDAEGDSFAPYNPIYAKYGRLAQGYQAQYVDFTRRGRMWASIKPTIEDAEPGRVTVVIASDNSEDQTKLNGQFKKRGNILRWDKQTIEAVRAANNMRVDQLVQKYIGE